MKIRYAMLFVLLMLPVLALAADSGVASEHRDNAAITREIVDPNDLTLVPRLTRKLVFRAVAKAKRGEHAEAAELLSSHLEAHPDQEHALVRYHLARSYDALEQYEDARREYGRAVELEPRLDAAWFGLGHVEYNLGHYGSSGVAFQRAFERALDPQPETLYFAAAGFMLEEDYASAAPLLDELCSGNWGTPRHDWYAQLASCALALEQPELARGHLDRYLQVQPDNHEAWFLQYQFEVGQKNYRDAAVDLTIVGYLRELTPREQRVLGDLYNVSSVPALASRRYRAAMQGEDVPQAEDYERLVSAYVASHDLDAALQTLEDGLASDPTPRLWSLLGDIHYLRQDYEGAITAFTELAELDPGAGRPALMIGYCHMELGNRGLAIQSLVAAAKFEDQEDLAVRLLQRARKMKKA